MERKRRGSMERVFTVVWINKSEGTDNGTDGTETATM